MYTMLLKELLEHFKSLRFTVGWLAVLILAILSSILLSNEYSRKLDSDLLSRKLVEEQVVEHGHINRIGAIVSPQRSVESSEALFAGLTERSRESGFYVDVINRLFPGMDLTFVIATFLSLLAIIFTYDSVCGERETGTLKLLHTTNITRWQVLLAKWLGAVLSIAMPMLVIFILSSLVANVFAGISLNLSFLSLLFFIFLGTIAYVGAFSALGILISSLFRSASSSILVLLFLWVLLVLAIPNASPIIASQIETLPSVATIEREMQRVRYNERDDRIEAETMIPTEEFLRKHGIEKPEADRFFELARILAKQDFYEDLGYPEAEAKALQVEFTELYFAEVERINEEQQEAMEQIGDELDREVDEQQNLARLISYLSPTSSLTYYSTDITNLGVQAEDDFAEQRGQYQEMFWEWASDRADMIARQEGVKVDFDDRMDFTGWPRFNFQPTAVADRFLQTMMNLVHMVVYTMLLFAAAVFAYERYDIR